MLKVNDNGVTVTLTGKGVGSGNGIFMFAFALLIGAVAVAVGLSSLPRQWAIGALALLVIGMFVFNVLRGRQKQQKGMYLTSGVLDVRYGLVSNFNGGRRQDVAVLVDDKIVNHGKQLTIYDKEAQKKCHISGFESAKEAQIVEQILQGQKLGKRNANIKIQST
ncbi:hypothetical protein VH441_07965 [Psychrobacter sp. HD31]|uniref:hypothetical protein n=1 Tax=Psychrobacter sp. HD31 TaxID=3112003 RepID=UPI003DA65F7D